MKLNRKWIVLFFVVPLILVLCLSACASIPPEEAEEKPVEDAETQQEEPEVEPPAEPETDVSEPDPMDTEEEMEEEVSEEDASEAYPADTEEEEEAAEEEIEESMENPLPSDPIALTIQTSDGVDLPGFFFPAATIDAPLVVLYHWAPGDQKDYEAIAPWFQNRGYQVDIPVGAAPFLDSSWFPVLPEDVSFNVVTFTFRGCEGGCQQFNPEGWQLDAEAVMDHITTLDNVDLSQVVTIGASIGADGAAYGCHYYNEAVGGCQGALSNSPGGYLNIPYPDEVTNLGQEDPPKPTWCVYSKGDGESANACENVSCVHYQSTAYEDAAHGMAMFEPSRDPNPMQIIVTFLNQLGLCEACN